MGRAGDQSKSPALLSTTLETSSRQLLLRPGHGTQLAASSKQCAGQVGWCVIWQFREVQCMRVLWVLGTAQ